MAKSLKRENSSLANIVEVQNEFQCVFCNWTTTTQLKLKNHLSKVHNDKVKNEKKRIKNSNVNDAKISNEILRNDKTLEENFVGELALKNIHLEKTNTNEVQYKTKSIIKSKSYDQKDAYEIDTNENEDLNLLKGQYSILDIKKLIDQKAGLFNTVEELKEKLCTLEIEMKSKTRTIESLSESEKYYQRRLLISENALLESRNEIEKLKKKQQFQSTLISDEIDLNNLQVERKELDFTNQKNYCFNSQQIYNLTLKSEISTSKLVCNYSEKSNFFNSPNEKKIEQVQHLQKNSNQKSTKYASILPKFEDFLKKIKK